jgi:rRNA maturation RNase YbeY
LRHTVAVRNDLGEPMKLPGVEKALLCLMRKFKMPEGEVAVLITDDVNIQNLNLRYRNMNEATDVLTFPPPTTVHGELGDIAISVDFARRQAELRGVPIEDEVAMLAIHGGLHLAGFDDHGERDRETMVRLMNTIASEVGLPTDPDWSSLPHGGSD